MRYLLLLALLGCEAEASELLYPGSVQGSPVIRKKSAELGPPVVLLDMLPGACGTGPVEGLTVARQFATGTYQCNGRQTAGANVPRIETGGLLIEPTGLEYLRNGTNCNNLTAQTSSALSAGPAYGRMTGTGSVVFTAGTAVSAQLPCTATASSDCPLTISTGGTIVATPDGQVLTGSLTNQSYPSSIVCANAGTYGRYFDLASMATPAAMVSASDIMVAMTADPMGTWASRGLWSIETAPQGTANANRIVADVTANDTVTIAAYNADATAATWTFPADWTDASDAKTITFWYSPTQKKARLWVDLVEMVGAGVTNPVTPQAASPRDTIYIGRGSFYYLAGRVSEFKACAESDPRRCLTTVQASCGTSPTGIAALGDSITRGYGATIPYSVLVHEHVGCAFDSKNYGVDGSKTDDMASRYTSTVRAYTHSWLVLMGGVNDMAQSVLATVAYANLTGIITAELAAGRSVVLLTTTPFKGFGTWTADKQTQQDALNALIATTPNVTVVDAWSLLVDPGTPNTLLPAYDSGDHIHPSQAGQAVLANAIIAAIPH